MFLTYTQSQLKLSAIIFFFITKLLDIKILMCLVYKYHGYVGAFHLNWPRKAEQNMPRIQFNLIWLQSHASSGNSEIFNPKCSLSSLDLIGIFITVKPLIQVAP